MNQPDPVGDTDPQPVAQSKEFSHEDLLSIDSTELLQNRREITIRHGEELYRLRLTKSGKLILHK